MTLFRIANGVRATRLANLQVVEQPKEWDSPRFQIGEKPEGSKMHGLMTEKQLLLIDILQHGAAVHKDAKLLTCTKEGLVHEYGYAEALRRVAHLAGALNRSGCSVGSMVGTLAWNSHQHFEIYYGTAAIGSVCHTINPRLTSVQIGELIEHAGDEILFVDVDLLPLVRPLLTRPGFPHLIVIGAAAEVDLPASSWTAYEQFLADCDPLQSWPSLDERTASSLCYTSGTTGKPKGILYSHRSSVLHAMSICRTDTWAVSGDDVICAFVPMFHVNGWGLPFAAPLCGADLILPGPHLSASDTYEIIEKQGVTLAFAVPTIWHDVLSYLEQTGGTFKTLKRVIVAGSALPPNMLTRFEERHGIEVLQVWGMTESSPMGMVSRLSRRMKGLSQEQQLELRLRQGHAVFGTELKLEEMPGGSGSETTEPLGECAMRGLWVASSYFRGDPEANSVFSEDGWFRTGDVATVNDHGFYKLVDRRKDAIKSGGEWISSIELESAALQDEQILDAAAVGLPHAKWGERPVLAVVLRDPNSFDEKRLLLSMSKRVQKWALPDHVFVVESLPKSSAGKILKSEVRVLASSMLLDAKTSAN